MSSKATTLTVAPPPHWRRKISIAKVNYAYVLALAPTALAGAIAHAYGIRAAELSASAGPMSRAS